MLVSCGHTTVRFWNVTDGKQLHQLEITDYCAMFDLNPGRTLLAVAHNSGVSIWDFSSRTKLTEINFNDVVDVRFNEDGTKLIVGQYDGQVSLVGMH